MLKQSAFEALSFKLQLPGNDSRDESRNCRQRSDKEIVVRRIRKGAALGRIRDEVEDNRDNEQCDREMDQDDVLGVFGKQHCFDIERV